MVKGKKGPYILLATLIIVVVFLLGLQYGKHIQEIDQSFEYVLSLTPTQQPSPSTTPISSYAVFSNSGCAISFLYPDSLHAVKESSTEALISTETNTKSIYMLCDQSKIASSKGASTEAQLDNKDALIYSDPDSEYNEIRVRNNQNQIVLLEYLKELEPLIIRSFSFID